jgi:hypothetical protein
VLEYFGKCVNKQIPNTNNQIMTEISIKEISPRPLPSGERGRMRGLLGHNWN